VQHEQEDHSAAVFMFELHFLPHTPCPMTHPPCTGGGTQGNTQRGAERHLHVCEGQRVEGVDGGGAGGRGCSRI